MLDTEIAQLRTLRSEAYRDKALRCVTDLYEFYVTFWFAMSGDPLVDNWHISYICDELQELGFRIVNKKAALYDLIINVPPGQSKSTMVSQAFPVWLWLHDPSLNIITSSYSGDLSCDHSLKSKNIVKCDLFNTLFQPYFLKRFGRYLKLTKDNEKDWRNNFGGGRYATSTGGTVTGKHAHLILRDDRSTRNKQRVSFIDSNAIVTMTERWRAGKRIKIRHLRLRLCRGYTLKIRLVTISQRRASR